MPIEHLSLTLPVPLGGLNYSLPETLLDHIYTRGMNNCMIEDGLIFPRQGYEEVGAGFPSSFPVMEGVEFGGTDGTIHKIFFTTRKMVRHTDSPTWTATSTLDLTGDDSNPIFASPVGGMTTENLYVTNGKDKLKVWTGTGNWADLTTTGFTTLKAKCLIGFRGHLLLGNVTENSNTYPYRVRRSAIGNPTVWNSVTSGYVDLIDDETNSKVMCFHPFGSVLIAYKFGSIFQLTYQGDPNYFTPRMVVADRGVISPKGVAPFGDAHLVVSNDNIHVFDGTGFITPAPGDRIKKEFYDNLNWDYREKIFVRAFPSKYIVAIACPTGASTVNDTIWFWNYRENTWTKHVFNDTVYSFINFNIGFDQITPMIGIDSNVHKLFTVDDDDGTAVSAYFETKLHNYREFNNEEIKAENLIKTMQRVEMDVSGTLPNVQIGSANSLLAAVDYDTAGTVVSGDTGVIKVEKRKSGRYLKLKVSNVNGEPFTAAQYTTYFEPRGSWR